MRTNKRKQNKTDFYKKNIGIIKTYYPDLYKWLINEKDNDWIDCIKNRNKENNILIKQGNKSFPVYDLDNPKKLSREIAKNSRLNREDNTIIVGMGLGHLLYQMSAKREKGHVVIIVEPVAQLIKLAFKEYDFSKWIKEGSLFIIHTKEMFADITSLLEIKKVTENWHILIEQYSGIRIGEYQDIIKIITATINQIRCNTGTIMGAGEEIANNDIANLPYVIRHRGIIELKDLYKGKPAVIIGTGSSLAINIHQLKAIQNKVIIIAVAQVLRILIPYGIVPDFLCTVDFGKVNLEHFEGLMDSKIPLIAINKTHAEILKRWQGTKFITANISAMDNSAASILIEKGMIEQGGSVAHLCLSSAIHLGCNPIMMVGIDLSYMRKDTSHIIGTDAAGDINIDDKGIINWKVTNPRSSLYGKKLNAGYVQYTEGYYGDYVITNQGFASFIMSFTNIILQYPKKTIINSTEFGAKIKGTKQMTLKQAIEKYCNEKIDKKIIKPFLSLAGNANDLVISAIVKLKNDIDILDEITKTSQAGLKNNKEMEKTDYKNKEKLLSLLNENYKLSVKTHEAAKKNQLVGTAIYHATRKLFSKEYGTLRHLKQQKKRDKLLLKDEKVFKNRLEANKMILEAAKKSSGELKKIYKKSLILLEKYQETGDEKILNPIIEDRPPDLADSELFFEQGNFAIPYCEAIRVLKTDKRNKEANYVLKKAEWIRNKAIKKAIEDEKINRHEELLEYNQLIIDSQKIGRDKQNFNKAKEMLVKAVEMFPDKIIGRWGLASAQMFSGDIEKAIENYDLIIKENSKHPEILRWKFERAQGTLFLNPLDGIKELEEIFKLTKQFDYFYKIIGDVYVKLNTLEKAIQSYAKYLETFPADYLIWDKLGDCYKQKHLFKKSELAHQKAQKLKK